MFYDYNYFSEEEEKEQELKFKEMKNHYFDSFKKKMPVYRKGAWYLYVLKLEYEKVYVGITHNPKKRLEKHFYGEGAVATTKFMPLEVLDIIESSSTRLEVEQVENMVSEQLFNKYGEENVYGGKYVRKFNLEKKVKF